MLRNHHCKYFEVEIYFTIILEYENVRRAYVGSII